MVAVNVSEEGPLEDVVRVAPKPLKSLAISQ